MRRFLLAALLLPLAAAAAPLSRSAAQACLDEVVRTKATADQAGPACAALLARIKAGADGVPGDADLAQTLGGLHADALRDFAATLADAGGAIPRAPADPSTVAAVLAGLPDPDARPRSLWEKVDAWLRRLLLPDEHGNTAPPPQWLLRLFQSLGHIPPLLVKSVAWLLFALLLASLVWVVVRELRAAGFTLRRRARATEPPLPQGEAPPAALFEGLPERERPAALLRWVIARLVAHGLLPADAALTNRELQALLPLAARTPFGALIAFAERAFFGGATLAETELDQAAALAQELTGRRVAA